ncbi:MAG TPA: hypothetical protein VFM18_23915, partial [Methanosarcina sp.]|nr:hypothetical protein [Methanosarcina sp.]
RGSRGNRAGIRLITSATNPKLAQRQSTVTQRSAAVLKKLTGGNSFADFLITDLSYGFSEKLQLSQVFGDHTVAYAFGASPVVLNISGVITDDIDNDWFVGFMLAYKDFLRGTQLARNFELAELTTNNAIFLGAITGVNVNQNAGNDAVIQFSLQFLVRSFEFYSASEIDQTYLDSVENLAAKMDGSFSLKSLKDAAKEAASSTLSQINSTINSKTSTNSGSCGSKSVSNASVGLDVFSNTSNAGNAASIDTQTGTVAGPQDSIASLNKIAGGYGITGLFNELTRIKGMNMSDDAKNTAIEKRLNSFLCDKDDGVILTAMGKYADTVDTASKKYDKISGFVNEVQRNVEYFNKLTSYLADPFADVRTIIGKVRRDVQKVTNIATLVKKSYSDLKHSKNAFKSLKGDLEALKKDIRNARGAIAAIPDTSSEKLSNSLRSGDAKLPPILGNAKLGITAAQAAAKLKGTNSPTLSDKLVIQKSSSSYNSNADKKAVLKF